MQANTLTFQVDATNTGTPAALALDRYEEASNRSVYVTAVHTPGSREMIALTRALPTKSGNFRGVSKGSLKFTQDVSVTGVDSNTTILAPIIVEVSFSLPVGCDADDVKRARQIIIGALDDDTFSDKLMIQQQV